MKPIVVRRKDVNDICENCAAQSLDAEELLAEVDAIRKGRVGPSREELHEVNEIFQKLLGTEETCFKRCQVQLEAKQQEKCNKLCLRKVNHEGECGCIDHRTQNQRGEESSKCQNADAA